MAEQWKRRRQILALLNESQHFVSGEELAKQLGVTRATISNHIDALEQAGVGVYSVKGKGYKLEKTVLLIDDTRLINRIPNRCFYFDEIDSTNSFILKHSDELTSGDVCIAEYQSAGRGRRGRTWVSPYASHLYCSLYWNFPKGMAQVMGLSLVVGCSLATVLENMGLIDIAVKWPNDVYLQNRKLAGILVEMSGQADGECQVVIGTGVNLSMPASQAELIDQPWSEVFQQQCDIDKTEFAIQFHQQLVKDLSLFEQQGLQAFMQRWSDVDLYRDKTVTLSMADNHITGVCRGIDEQGALLLDIEGKVTAYIGGEISARGIF